MVLLCTGIATPAAAQGWIESSRPPADGDVVRTRTAVSVRVTGRRADVTVDEWFQNRGGRVAEGDYLYPLPGEATFTGFSLFQGEEELRGETMDADRARAIYQDIVRRRKDPALIEFAGHGLIRARVFPIEAGQTRRITLRYTQMLERAGESLVFRYAAGGRYRPAGSEGERAGQPRRVVESSPVHFELVADSAPQFHRPFSPPTCWM